MSLAFAVAFGLPFLLLVVMWGYAYMIRRHYRKRRKADMTP